MMFHLLNLFQSTSMKKKHFEKYEIATGVVNMASFLNKIQIYICFVSFVGIGSESCPKFPNANFRCRFVSKKIDVLIRVRVRILDIRFLKINFGHDFGPIPIN